LNSADLDKALALLKDKTGIAVDQASFKQSSLIELSKQAKFNTRDIDKAVESGDLFAQALMVYSATRIADFLIDTIQREQRVSAEHPLKMISFSGGWMRGLSKNCPQAWNKLETRLQEVFGKDLKLHYVKPEDGFDGTIELAKNALLQGRESQDKPGLFKRLWQSVKKLFGFSS
jgi:hypothetical protein